MGFAKVLLLGALIGVVSNIYGTQKITSQVFGLIVLGTVGAFIGFVVSSLFINIGDVATSSFLIALCGASGLLLLGRVSQV